MSYFWFSFLSWYSWNSFQKLPLVLKRELSLNYWGISHQPRSNQFHSRARVSQSTGPTCLLVWWILPLHVLLSSVSFIMKLIITKILFLSWQPHILAMLSVRATTLHTLKYGFLWMLFLHIISRLLSICELGKCPYFWTSVSWYYWWAYNARPLWRQENCQVTRKPAFLVTTPDVDGQDVSGY